MDFFQQLAALNLKGTLNLTIAPSSDGLVVSVRLDNQNVTDAARKNIPPLLLKGTGQQLDEGFFSSLNQPLKQVSALLTNMETFQKGVETAAANSAIEKKKADEAKKIADEAKKGYDAAMKKVTELETESKWREAYGKLPKPEAFPTYAKAIKDKQTELRQKFSQGSLFDMMDDNGEAEYEAQINAVADAQEPTGQEEETEEEEIDDEVLA